MSIKEIERAIVKLNGEELDELSSWLAEYRTTKRRGSLLELVGTIDSSDLQTIALEIETGCEMIDPKDW